MEDRSCFKCKETFRYPSTLKIHLEISSRCAISKEEIDKFFLSIQSNKKKNKKEIQQPIQPSIKEQSQEPIQETIQEQNKNKLIIKFNCIICNKLFTRKSSLLRHQREIICQSPIEVTTQVSIQAQTNIPNQINNTTNNNNTINNTFNNIINNTTIIQHINPFGFEDVRAIPIPEMKAILSSGNNAGFQIIKTIYNKFENKNFYKPNMSRPEIACLNTEFNLTIYKNKEFCDALFDRCIAFLHHMLYLCKHEYSKTSIKNIYENIEYIETTMRTEIYDKQLQNIIESEFRNNNLDNKDRISKFIKEIKDNLETKEQSTSLLNNVLTLSNESHNEYKISISEKEINNALGDPKVLLGLIKPELIDEFTFNRFEDTRFYKFWIDRIKNENIYVNKSKTATIGDIKNLKIRKTKIDLMMNIIQSRAENLKPRELIDLDVEGFVYEHIQDDEHDTSDVDFANVRDLEGFEEIENL